MYYRSDWPEIGLRNALSERGLVRLPVCSDDNQSWRQETQVSRVSFRWVAAQSEFESDLYGFPMWNLHFEVNDSRGDVLTAHLDSAMLREHVDEVVHQVMDAPPWNTAYVCSKVVKGEPLYDALLRVGFEAVEHRRLYICQVRDIISGPLSPSAGDIQLASFAAIAPEQIGSYREQILDICREAFDQKGYSRHFTDPVLLKRLPGIAYILAAMELNFERVEPAHFLVAVDVDSDHQVCGFSAIGRRSGFKAGICTQILSAVRKAYRGRGIYRGLTNLLSQTLPHDATLLNVTHVGNAAIQRAYQGSGRVHLADTVVLRRIFQANGWAMTYWSYRSLVHNRGSQCAKKWQSCSPTTCLGRGTSI